MSIWQLYFVLLKVEYLIVQCDGILAISILGNSSLVETLVLTLKNMMTFQLRQQAITVHHTLKV